MALATFAGLRGEKRSRSIVCCFIIAMTVRGDLTVHVHRIDNQLDATQEAACSIWDLHADVRVT